MSFSKPSIQTQRQPASLPTPESTRSFWHSEPSPLLLGHRSTRNLPETADVVVIGSGITGASIAHHLLENNPSLSVVMLEAREACWGATGRVSPPNLHLQYYMSTARDLTTSSERRPLPTPPLHPSHRPLNRPLRTLQFPHPRNTHRRAIHRLRIHSPTRRTSNLRHSRRGILQILPQNHGIHLPGPPLPHASHHKSIRARLPPRPHSQSSNRNGSSSPSLAL